MTHRTARDILLLLALCALLFLPGAAFRGLAGMEFRTALFVREILARGPSLIPRLDGLPYFDYPPLYFLAAALSSRLLGSITPLSLALPSMLAAAGTVLLAYRMAAGERPGAALRAGAALALTPLFFSCASRGIVDPMLAFFTTLTIAGCRRRVSTGRKRWLAAACLGLAGGTLTKGPVGAALPIGAVSLWLLAGRRVRPLLRLLLPLGIFLAALLLAFISAAGGAAAIRPLLEAQFLDRFADEANAPPHYYLLVFLAGFAPWSLFAFPPLLASAGRAFRGDGGGRAGPGPLYASWFLSTLAILTAARIKHSRYLLPAAPPIAVLAAFSWDGLRADAAHGAAAALAAWTRRVCLAALAAGAAALAVAPFFIPVSSAALACLLPPACLLPLAVRPLRRVGGADGAFILIAWTLSAGLLAFGQFDGPRMAAREEARPFVHAVERAAAGRRIVFHGVDKDSDGLKFRWWRTGASPLSFTDSLPDLRAALASPAILVVPSASRAEVERELGPRLRPLHEGALGRRRCAVFDLPVTGGPPEPPVLK